MKKTVAAPPDLLLSRFTPNPEAFAGMKIATLKMPYDYSLWEFSSWLEKYLNKYDSNSEIIYRKPPYRLLNSAIVACAPTLAHAFEWYDDWYNNDKGRRMLVVTKPDAPLIYPSVSRIAGVMRQWVRVWHDSSPWLQEAVASVEGKEKWESLLAVMREPPDTDWCTEYDLLNLFQDGGSHHGDLGNDAIPNLLVTLLHETESVIQGRTVRWRRMQEGGPHLCLLSEPIPVIVTRTNDHRNSDGKTVKKTESRNAYFCYRIEVRLHIQAGREKPWIYFKTHCTRLAQHPLVRNKRGTEITLLAGINEARIEGWDRDTTLVRLKASKNVKAAEWLDKLPELLARIEARPLPSPKDICENPTAYWGQDEAGLRPDEYYIVHTEGYEYAESSKRGKKHAVYSGLPLPEQAEIISTLTNGFLRDALTPDTPLSPESFCFDKASEPNILRDIDELRKFWGDRAAESTRATPERDVARQQYRDHWRPKLLEAIQRGTRGKRLVIPCFYSSPHTLEWMRRGLWSESLLLTDGEQQPESVTLLPVPIPASHADLVRPCPVDAEGKPPRYAAIKVWRESLLQNWFQFIDETIGTYLTDTATLVSAVVELDTTNDPEQFRKNNMPASASVHGIIREAFVRKDLRVQMTFPLGRPIGNPKLDSGSKGKVQNVVQEVVTRQLGTVFGLPSDLYRAVGMDNFGSVVSNDLDVIAFSFRSSHTGIRYCLATRLRADGSVDVLLPDEKEWMPYATAYTKLGTIFAQSRKYIRGEKLTDGRQDSLACPLRLPYSKPADFVRSVLTTQYIDKPTIALIEAENWSQVSASGGGWWQLKNPSLEKNRNRLVFSNGKVPFRHERSEVAPLLGVIRLRTGDETPAYATNQRDWRFDGELPMPNYERITGFVDNRPNIFHYLSINGIARTNKDQPQFTLRDKKFRYKIAGSEHAFKHAPVIEMVPFCVAESFDGPDGEGLKALCRVAHYLRVHPGWGLGEVNSAYPLHLGDTLIKDQETILGLS